MALTYTLTPEADVSVVIDHLERAQAVVGVRELAMDRPPAAAYSRYISSGSDALIYASQRAHSWPQ